MMDRKGQEEMTGFVLVVVLVAVILVVFLGVTLRNDSSSSSESIDVSQFLDAMMEYTSDCALDYEPAYSELDELIRECYSDPSKKCVSGRNVCDQAKNITKSMVDASWPSGVNRPVKGWILESNYVINTTVIGKVITLNSGNCTGNFRGAEHFSASLPGNIVTSLRVCS